MFLLGLFCTLHAYKQGCVIVCCDNQSFIHLIKNPQHSEMTKYVDFKFHFVGDVVKRGLIYVDKVHASVSPTNMLIKIVITTKFQVCKDLTRVDNLVGS